MDFRDVAQLVARHVRDVEVAGSSPVIPTTSFHPLLIKRDNGSAG